jgi:hypothetical protein
MLVITAQTTATGKVFTLHNIGAEPTEAASTNAVKSAGTRVGRARTIAALREQRQEKTKTKE